jgi:hypothetical protein
MMNCLDKKGKTPLDLACDFGEPNPLFTAFLEKHGAKRAEKLANKTDN